MKKGINLHCIKTNKFKTNLIAFFLTTPLTRECVTKNALLVSTLRRGCKKLKTQEEISKKLEEMYGAEFNCGLDKLGKNHVLKFYIESVNNDFLPEDSVDVLNESIEILSEIILNPLVNDNGFNKDYLNQEKENVRQIIEAKKDNKSRYALFRCVEEMYKDMPQGLYKYGYAEDLTEINERNLYEYYNKLINECKIDIFVSGKIDKDELEKIIEKNENIKKISEREPKYIINRPEIKKANNKENKVEEKMEVTQGKLVMGYDIEIEEKDVKSNNFRYIGMLYNAILGGTANSKMFQNVREKESLAYTANSSFSYYTGNIFLTAGIEIDNFERATKIIKQQVEDMKKGDFTKEDIENAKNVIISNITTISDEQDTEIIYWLGQELTGNSVSLREYANYIQEVNKDEIIDFAKKVNINTIYFLKK